VTTNPPGAGLAFSLFIHRQRHPAFKKFSQSHPLRIIDTRRSQFQLYTTVLRERLKIPPLTARMSGAVVDLVCSDQLSRGLRAWQARLRHPAGRLLGDCDLLRSTSQLLVSYAQGEGYGRCAGAVVLGYTAGAHRSIWRSNVRLRRNTGGPLGVSKATGRVRACAMRTRVPARGKQKFHVSCTHRVVLFWRKWFIRE
jgi:hypothetical protein